MDTYTYATIIIGLDLLLLSALVAMTVSFGVKEVAVEQDTQASQEEKSQASQEGESQEEQSQEGESQEEDGQSQPNQELNELDMNLPSEIDFDQIEFQEFRHGWNASWGVEPYPNDKPIPPPAPLHTSDPYPVGTRLRFFKDWGYQGVVVTNGMFFINSAAGSTWSDIVKLEDWLILANAMGGGAISIPPEGAQFFVDKVGEKPTVHDQVWGWSGPNWSYQEMPKCACNTTSCIPINRVPTSSDFTTDFIPNNKYD
jgi:hypothetical protein